MATRTSPVRPAGIGKRKARKQNDLSAQMQKAVEREVSLSGFDLAIALAIIAYQALEFRIIRVGRHT